MRRGTCPKCGQTNIRAARSCTYWHGASTTGQLRVRTSSEALSAEVASLVDLYVCVTCGYSEQYLMSSEAIHTIASTWAYVQPS